MPGKDRGAALGSIVGARADAPEQVRLREALASQAEIWTTGLVLQELLQGFRGPEARDAIVARFECLPMIVPDRADHIAAG